MSFGNETVTLPVGLEIDGTVYKTVTISEMNGYDEENMSARSIQNNGAKAQTILLRRSIQEIEGLVSRKRDPNELIKTEYVHNVLVRQGLPVLLYSRSRGIVRDRNGTPL
jgi:hypothetical protein